MSKGHGFDVRVIHEERELRITGTISKFYPAVMHLPNGDPGYPAEGGEIEDYVITDAETGEAIEDDDGKILEAVADDVYEQAAANAEDDKEDADERRAEARLDAGLDR